MPHDAMPRRIGGSHIRTLTVMSLDPALRSRIESILNAN
ncbi:MAG TPA: monothiol glutaredoxin, Grx4 family, partial [Stenotrophomonas sp.]|nr:monothiol glutaredoxin, Grx4 family [Stenotrophomonas sp.]